MDRFVYCLLRAVLFPISLLPLSWVRGIGKTLGTLAFYCMREYRKRALSNLSLADTLHLSNAEIWKIAREAFQNFAMTSLEFCKLQTVEIICENPEVAPKGAKVFFCGHMNNWEVLFLEVTSKSKGIAIGKPIKNKYLYDWVTKIRESNGGTMILPRQAAKEGLRALRKGELIGIVGDQGMPESGYSFPFFGRTAWTSTLPALLAYRTNAPLIFTNAVRTKKGFRVRYSPAIFPDLSKPFEEEVPRMMSEVLTFLEERVRERPGDYLWQHNRYKQQTMHNLYRRFRQDSILVVIPEQKPLGVDILESIYDKAFVTYASPETAFQNDYRYKLVLDFVGLPALKRHYLKLGATAVLNTQELTQIASEHLLPHHTLSDILLRALCRPHSIWRNDAG